MIKSDNQLLLEAVQHWASLTDIEKEAIRKQAQEDCPEMNVTVTPFGLNMWGAKVIESRVVRTSPVEVFMKAVDREKCNG